MSYDFRLFRPKAGEATLATARRGSEGLPTTPPDQQKEALKQKVANGLIAHEPQLEVFQFNYGEIAKSQKISEEDARLRYRHLELNGPNDANGIQIILFDDEASVTVPFWHEGENAADAFRRIWGLLEIIHRETGYLVYDPQIDRAFDPAVGYGEALACYTGAVRQVREMLPTKVTGRKPWWRFW